MKRVFILLMIGAGLTTLVGCSSQTQQEKSISLQIKELKTQDFDKYRDTIVALGKLGAPAVKPLLKGLKDGDVSVRCGCAEALGKIGDAQAVEPLIKKLKDRHEYIVRQGYTTIYSQSVRTSCAQALGNIGDKRAVEPLIKMLKDQDPSHREAAMWALAKIGDERAIEPLIERVNDRYHGLCEIAGDALNQLTGANYYDDYEAWKRWYRDEYRPQS